ncbi:MAG: ATP-binding protein [Promethearchaeota archaeon]
MSEDVFEKLREKISVSPLKLPKKKQILEILKTLYTEEEANIIIENFGMPFFDRFAPKRIAKKLGKDPEEIEAMFEELVKKGLLFKAGKKYSNLPLLPGMMEGFFSSKKSSNKDKEIIANLYEAYLPDFTGSLAASNYPWIRIMPTMKSIEINESIESDYEILPFEIVKQQIENNESIVVIPCMCRSANSQLSKELKRDCDKPLETCLSFGIFADWFIDAGLGRKISKEEAIQIVKECEEKGLIHSTTNYQDEPLFICNCCSDCCTFIRGLKEFGNPKMFARSNFIAVVNDNCNRCEVCVDKCVFEAIEPIDGANGVEILEEKCMGCGNCINYCPNDAIRLVKVRNEVPEKTVMECFTRFDNERI